MNMKNTVEQRLEDLREVMRREHLAAFIFPSTDPHQSEYVADHWKSREWISGFCGSAGTAVVTMTGAALWTDSRYFISAEQELSGTEYQLMRLKMEGTPTIAQWIGRELADGRHGSEVGIDGMVCSASEVRQLTADLRREGGLTLRTNLDPLRTIWRDRPPMPCNPVEVWPMAYAGEAAHDKLARIRRALREHHADGMLMAALDDIAWTLNLRGSDVHCNPVFVAYLLISTSKATLYTDPRRLSDDVVAYLSNEGVEVDDYGNVARGLKDYFEYNILLDPNEVNHTLFKAVGREVVEEESPVKRMKTVKNTHEQAGLRRAMLRDGIALVRFLKWLDEHIGTAPDGQLTEMGVDEKLTALCAEQPEFRGLSFDTVAAYEEHGAIIHYMATPETNAALQPHGLLLVDFGAQYIDGTTDTTRTIALGPVSEAQRRVYTLVLKAHIQLELAQFPSGVSGTQLDALAKQPLWREGLTYLHGTGHGVGVYLCVHEGPHQIRMEWKPAPLVAGMTVTDEPGVYLAGHFGVRIENTLLIVDAPQHEPIPELGCAGDDISFLAFEPLTLCPIDKRPIDPSLLTDEETRWLNDYHQTVYERIAPHLTADEQAWLRQATAPL